MPPPLFARFEKLAQRRGVGLIGPDFKPFYSWMKGKDLGVNTWPGEMWKQGARAPWGWVSYDPDLNEIYYGTSNPGPRTPSQMSKRSKSTASSPRKWTEPTT